MVQWKGEACAIGGQKELAEFNAEEKDMLQSIGALKSAITVLSKHHSSFAQVHRQIRPPTAER